MKKLVKIVLCLSFAFIFSISSGIFSAGKASAALINSEEGYLYHIYVNETALIPKNDNWLFPSTNGSGTDLTLTITTDNFMHSTCDGIEYKVYLQRPINNVWTTVGHAGYPVYGTKTVTFTREYNNSYLYPTTPYRFLILDQSGTNTNIELESVHYTAY